MMTNDAAVKAVKRYDLDKAWQLIAFCQQIGFGQRAVQGMT